MTDLIYALLWGFCASVIGFAVVTIMGSDDTPLSWYFLWASDWQERGGWRSWIASPLGGCVLCTSGQIGVWTYVAQHWPCPNWFLAVVSGSTGVLCAYIINAWYQKKQRHL